LDLLFDPNNCKVYELKELYENSTLNYPALNKKAIIDLMDCSKTENALIAINSKLLKNKTKRYTHLVTGDSAKSTFGQRSVIDVASWKGKKG
jgi:hypothetical protein